MAKYYLVEVVFNTCNVCRHSSMKWYWRLLDAYHNVKEKMEIFLKRKNQFPSMTTKNSAFFFNLNDYLLGFLIEILIVHIVITWIVHIVTTCTWDQTNLVWKVLFWIFFFFLLIPLAKQFLSTWRELRSSNCLFLFNALAYFPWHIPKDVAWIQHISFFGRFSFPLSHPIFCIHQKFVGR